MSLPRFAALQSRLNSAVLRHLSDVEVCIDGRYELVCVNGLSIGAYEHASIGAVGMDGQRVAVMVPADSLPADIVGARASIGDTQYIVAAAIPDGGLITLELTLP